MRSVMEMAQYSEDAELTYSATMDIDHRRLRTVDWQHPRSRERKDWCVTGQRRVHVIPSGESDEAVDDRSVEIQGLAAERLELVSLKYSGHDTPEILGRLHSITQRLMKLVPPVKDEAVRALEDISDKLEEFSQDIERLDALIKG